MIRRIQFNKPLILFSKHNILNNYPSKEITGNIYTIKIGWFLLERKNEF